MVAESADSGTRKKKNPPTFQHLPEKRAKALKRAWVETKKIKSKWRAQKRKEMPQQSAKKFHSEQNLTEDKEEQQLPTEDNAHNPAELKDIYLSQREKSIRTPAKVTPAQSFGGRTPKDRKLSKGTNHLETGKHESEETVKFSGNYQKKPSNRQVVASVSGRGRGSYRGQPDMKLQMNIMLEKIRRDFT